MENPELHTLVQRRMDDTISLDVGKHPYGRNAYFVRLISEKKGDSAENFNILSITLDEEGVNDLIHQLRSLRPRNEMKREREMKHE